MTNCRRPMCPVHGMSWAARDYRQRIAHQQNCNHVAWSAHIAQHAPDYPAFTKGSPLMNRLRRVIAAYWAAVTAPIAHDDERRYW